MEEPTKAMVLAGVKTLRHLHDSGVLKITNQDSPESMLSVMKGIVEGIYGAMYEEHYADPDKLTTLIAKEMVEATAA